MSAHFTNSLCIIFPLFFFEFGFKKQFEFFVPFSDYLCYLDTPIPFSLFFPIVFHYFFPWIKYKMKSRNNLARDIVFCLFVIKCLFALLSWQKKNQMDLWIFFYILTVFYNYCHGTRIIKKVIVTTITYCFIIVIGLVNIVVCRFGFLTFYPFIWYFFFAFWWQANNWEYFLCLTKVKIIISDLI